MDSNALPVDRLSMLPDELLVHIISTLPFKDCVKTSVLSTRWKHLCLHTKHISFKECEYVTPFISVERTVFSLKLEFVSYMLRWMSQIHDQVLETFEIYLSNPENLTYEINALIALAASKNVKKLVLDFSNPTWESYRDLSESDVLVEVPESVYKLTTLEFLKVYACQSFDPSRFKNPRKLRSLSFGWMKLPNVEYLLSKSTMLESLSLNNCWGLDFEKITGDMREFILENCEYLLLNCYIYLPKVDIFKYTGGDIYCLNFEVVNNFIKEVYLDFDMVEEVSEPYQMEGDIICTILHDLRLARTLTLCTYLLQVLQDFDYWVGMLFRMETKHLVLKTLFHPNEFNGIRLLLLHCPDLEKLTFVMFPPSSKVMASHYDDINPETYRLPNIKYECLFTTLKVVVVRNFVGGQNEFNMLRYLIWCGCLHESSLKRIELYISSKLDKRQKMLAHVRAEMLRLTSKHVQVLVYNS